MTREVSLNRSMITVQTMRSYRKSLNRCRGPAGGINGVRAQQDVVNLRFGIILLICVHNSARSKKSVYCNEIACLQQ